VRAKVASKDDSPSSDGGAAARDGLVQLELSQAERATNAAVAQATLAAAAVKRISQAAETQRTWYAEQVARLQAEVNNSIQHIALHLPHIISVLTSTSFEPSFTDVLS
jgi:hypothetical protein